MSDIETKLAAARTRLILDKPFLGALVLRLPMKPAGGAWCATTATDARAFYYNPSYIEKLSLEQTQFMLAHEALHCALSHFARRQHRLKSRWDMACDHAINPLLIKDGLKPPPGVVILEQFAGMAAEEIYPCIDENTTDGPIDQHLYDADGGEGGSGGETENQVQGQGKGPSPAKDADPGKGGKDRAPKEETGERFEDDAPEPLSANERDQLAQRWQQYLASAAQNAKTTGKLPSNWARLVDHLLEPKLPWRAILHRYLSQTARDDYSYARPSRREGEVVLPSLRSHEIDLVVVVDTSGSIGQEELAEFLTEVDALKAQVRARVTLHACDAAMAADGPWLFESWQEVALPRAFTGGGGTSFLPPFAWIDDSGRRPDVLVYFTDAEGDFPEVEPAYPVIWLVKGAGTVPWGLRVQLN